MSDRRISKALRVLCMPLLVLMGYISATLIEGLVIDLDLYSRALIVSSILLVLILAGISLQRVCLVDHWWPLCVLVLCPLASSTYFSVFASVDLLSRLLTNGPDSRCLYELYLRLFPLYHKDSLVLQFFVFLCILPILEALLLLAHRLRASGRPDTLELSIAERRSQMLLTVGLAIEGVIATVLLLSGIHNLGLYTRVYFDTDSIFPYLTLSLVATLGSTLVVAASRCSAGTLDRLLEEASNKATIPFVIFCTGLSAYYWVALIQVSDWLGFATLCVSLILIMVSVLFYLLIFLGAIAKVKGTPAFVALPAVMAATVGISAYVINSGFEGAIQATIALLMILPLLFLAMCFFGMCLTVVCTWLVLPSLRLMFSTIKLWRYLQREPAPEPFTFDPKEASVTTGCSVSSATSCTQLFLYHITELFISSMWPITFYVGALRSFVPPISVPVTDLLQALLGPIWIQHPQLVYNLFGTGVFSMPLTVSIMLVVPTVLVILTEVFRIEWNGKPVTPKTFHKYWSAVTLLSFLFIIADLGALLVQLILALSFLCLLLSGISLGLVVAEDYAKVVFVRNVLSRKPSTISLR